MFGPHRVADVVEITEDTHHLEPALHRPEVDFEGCFVALRLAGFRASSGSWLMTHLRRWDNPDEPLEAESVGNQTSPLFVYESAESSD